MSNIVNDVTFSSKRNEWCHFSVYDVITSFSWTTSIFLTDSLAWKVTLGHIACDIETESHTWELNFV